MQQCNANNVSERVKTESSLNRTNETTVDSVDVSVMEKKKNGHAAAGEAGCGGGGSRRWK